MKKGFNFKLNLAAAAVLMTTGVANASVANVAGNGTESNPYNLGVIGASPSVLAVTLNGAPGSSFTEFANFTIPTLSTTTASANTYTLNLGGLNLFEIVGLTVSVWRDVHPSTTTLYSTFSGDNFTNFVGNLDAGQYHLDINGFLGDTASVGQYSVALQAVPVPEPETYAMLLAGLGLVGLSTRRRKKIR